MSKLKPLSWIPSLVIFVITSAMIYLTHYVFAPAFKAATGLPYMIGYLIGWIFNMAVVFAASLIAYRLEGNPFTRSAFTARFRLTPMNRRDWLWTLAILLFTLVGFFGLGFTSQWLSSIPIFAPHPAFPQDFVTGITTPGELFEMPLKGQWWLIIVYFIGWVLNILGEEFWYRGWMLPRQELAFGRRAWIVNSLMFTFQHWLQPWRFLSILVGSLFAVYVVQRRRNTWLMIIQHGTVNVLLLVYIICGVIGI
jgi:membrane protease YdiL (CAAX protease family)